MGINEDLKNFLSKEQELKEKISEKELLLSMEESEIENNFKKNILKLKEDLTNENNQSIHSTTDVYKQILDDLDKKITSEEQFFSKSSKEQAQAAADEAFNLLTNFKFIK